MELTLDIRGTAGFRNETDLANRLILKLNNVTLTHQLISNNSPMTFIYLINFIIVVLVTTRNTECKLSPVEF